MSCTLIEKNKIFLSFLLSFLNKLSTAHQLGVKKSTIFQLSKNLHLNISICLFYLKVQTLSLGDPWIF